jgi:uncharacterized repeat protein (TIGR02543 family)
MLTAAARAGYVFAGWYMTDSAQGEKAPGEYRATSYSYVSTGDTAELYARFVPKSEDFAPEIMPIGDQVANADGSFELNVGSMIVSVSQPTVTVTGLPTGISYNRTTNIISGTTTKPGVYAVKISVTNVSNKTPAQAVFTLTVLNLRSEKFDEIGLADYYNAYAGSMEDVSNLMGCIVSLTADGWTIRVTGLPAGLVYKYDTRNQTATITGTATKEGSSTVYFEASKRGETTQTATTTVRVEFPTLTVVSSEEAWGTATVNGNAEGRFPVGTKVTLIATAKPDCVFAGWYKNDLPLEGTVDYRTATYTYVTEDAPQTIVAKFMLAGEDLDSIDLTVTGQQPIYTANADIAQQVSVSSISLPTVTVTGLPTGLKFDAQTMTITGKATKPGELATAVFIVRNMSETIGKRFEVQYKIGDARVTTGPLSGLLYDTIPGTEGGYALIVPGDDVDMLDLLELVPDDLAGWTITGLPTGITFNSLTGTFAGKATQAGKTYIVTFKKGSEMATISLATKSDPTLTLTKYLLVRDDIDSSVSSDTYYSSFKLTGGGNYQVGKSVTVSATAPKNWIFLGWAMPTNYDPRTETVRLTMVSSNATYTFNMLRPADDETNEVELTAVFTHIFGSAIVPDNEIEE